MIRFTIYTYLFKPINEPQEPDMFSPEVKVDESLAMKQELLGELFKAESKLRSAVCVLDYLSGRKCPRERESVPDKCPRQSDFVTVFG